MVAEVAIIGAGASGLCAARHLLSYNLRPTIFERSSSIGGLWSSSPTTQNGKNQTWDNMRTNLSRHTCSFTDFPWDSSDDDDDSSSSSSHDLFPRGKDVQNYLERYADRYVRDHCHLEMNCHVRGVSRDGDDRYRLRWTTTSTTSSTTDRDDEWQEKSFDGVVISSGFFSQPYIPPFLIKSPSGTMRTVLHSSEYRSPSQHENQIVAVVGGSHSAIDIAADVARRAKQVWSIIPRIPYVLPRFLIAEGEESAMTTIDDALYHRSPPPTTTSSSSNEDKWKRQHDLLEGFTDRHRSYQAFGSHPSREEPPRVAISDDYLGWVSTGRIKVIHGRVVDHPSETTTTTTTTSSLFIQTSNDDIVTISEIDSIICGTGYESPPLSPLLSDDILSTLQHDSSSNYAPFIACHDVYHPSLPRLGFVGMYKGPYFGVLDLQARLVARRMLIDRKEDDGDNNNDERWLEESRRIRQDAAANHNLRPQFPRGDYVKLMDRFAHLLNITPFFQNSKGNSSMILPAHYQPDESLAHKAQESYERDVRNCREGEYISSIVMKRLMGRWHFKRHIVHHGNDAREESVMGRVLFMPPSTSNETKKKEEVLRYREDGKWTFNGKEFDVFREYEYVRQIMENDDENKGRTMDIHFVEEGKRAHLFLSLMFHRGDHDGGGIVWEATSDHLCIADLYKGRFRVTFDDKGVGIKQVEMEYRVKGPSKDYTAITQLHPV